MRTSKAKQKLARTSRAAVQVDGNVLVLERAARPAANARRRRNVEPACQLRSRLLEQKKNKSGDGEAPNAHSLGDLVFFLSSFFSLQLSMAIPNVNFVVASSCPTTSFLG